MEGRYRYYQTKRGGNMNVSSVFKMIGFGAMAFVIGLFALLFLGAVYFMFSSIFGQWVGIFTVFVVLCVFYALWDARKK